MQALRTTTLSRRFAGQPVAWLAVLLLISLLWLSEAPELLYVWRNDVTLSHGPLVPLITAGLLWSERDRLRRWDAACLPGLGFLLISALLYVGGVWADIDFLKPLALIGVVIGGIWFLGGGANLRAAIGPLGFLIFMIPWPTTLVDRLAFPLQLMSSSYAALFAGLAGVPIHRDGVNLYVTPSPQSPPIYSITVAQACSGLNSLMALLALSYLIAYFTPVRLGWKLLLIATVAPLTLLANSVRLTVVLMAGGHHHKALAQWIHDNEGPVLIFLCSLALTALRHGLLTWTQPAAAGEPRRNELAVASASEPMRHSPE